MQPSVMAVEVGLADPTKFVGFTQNDGELNAIVLRNHGLHIEIQIDPRASRWKGTSRWCC